MSDQGFAARLNRGEVIVEGDVVEVYRSRFHRSAPPIVAGLAALLLFAYGIAAPDPAAILAALLASIAAGAIRRQAGRPSLRLDPIGLARVDARRNGSVAWPDLASLEVRRQAVLLPGVIEVTCCDGRAFAVPYTGNDPDDDVALIRRYATGHAFPTPDLLD